MSTPIVVLETTTIDQKAAETEPVPGYNDYNENISSNTNLEEKTSEEENNEIDLTHTTESPTSEISITTYKYDKSTSSPVENEHLSHLSQSNRIRSTKILDENNSARNMPEMHPDSFPWTWAKNILLEKPIMKKTSQN